ncbi:conjugal transfer protein [Enterococcus gallinarum]|uniref:conjugal transfer protein n=1 Tax=Enterococcus gallinarum TaxID=1353 RepID=UPI0018AA9639|nr:conjugal transfer protein [Enterococcus gallinarum]
MNLKFKKKEKDTIESIPKKKGIQAKGVKRVVLGGLVLVLFSGVGAYMKAGAVGTHVSSVEKSVNLLKNNVEESNREKISFTPELESFMDRFVQEYMNIPDNDDAFQARSKSLMENFYAEGLVENEVSFSAKRSLKDATLISLKLVDGVAVASYKVTYEIERPVTKKVEEKQKDKKGKETITMKEVTEQQKIDASEVVNIPFVSKVGTFCVVAYPYFTEPVTTKANANALTYDMEKRKGVDQETEQAVQTFVSEFLTKYCESSSSDMAYMMDSPEGLNNHFTLDKVESKVYQADDGIEVKADVALKDKDTAILQKEQLTLHLVKKSDKYYVKKLSHTWKDGE